jgi:PAS domain-containing protein
LQQLFDFEPCFPFAPDSTAMLATPDQTQRESERRFRALLDALPAAVYTIDTGGRITFFN